MVNRVLVVDDDATLVRLIEYNLKEQGYETCTAHHGREGLRQVEAHSPDLVILDVMMPEMDGWETCRRIREISAVPIIMLTAKGEEHDVVQGLGLGADEYVIKPFGVQELLARVKAVLRRADLSRQEGLTQAEAQIDVLRKAISRNVSHELRTPLSIILASLHLALDRRFGNDPEGQRQFIQQSLDSAQRLHGLIDDLLVLSMQDQGQDKAIREVISLQQAFHKPIQQGLHRWQARGLDLHVTVEPAVQIHAFTDRFRQSVFHLIDNACKFSPPGGRIDVELAANGEGGCVLTVIDEGPGIPPELRERVFERYFQASEGDARLYEGLGVGLTIARAFARGLGGDVVILDAARGCHVQMTIPPAPADF